MKTKFSSHLYAGGKIVNKREMIQSSKNLPCVKRLADNREGLFREHRSNLHRRIY
jgi:hypothetical protein